LQSLLASVEADVEGLEEGKVSDSYSYCYIGVVPAVYGLVRRVCSEGVRRGEDLLIVYL